MSIEQIEENIDKLLKNLSKEEFIYELLLSYGIPKSTVTLLKKGSKDRSKRSDEVMLQRKVLFRSVQDGDLHDIIDDLKTDKSVTRYAPRFLIVTDFKTLLATDLKTAENLDISIFDLKKFYDFFLPWAGIEKHSYRNEAVADRKAAERMAKLYDSILADNHLFDETKVKDLNFFLARLLFCFFAEDTQIFPNECSFTNAIDSHTRKDGSDLNVFFSKLFHVLSLPEGKRGDIPHYLDQFPYVNGGLFNEDHWIPKFSAQARRIIIESGQLDWSKINPDIFGSMMQAVVHPGERGSLGMHYTSVPNILKTIEPLFLNEFRRDFEAARGNLQKLDNLRLRLSKLKIFDPACGSGNFLVIAYKELRRLEMHIIREMGAFSFSDIKISQFYGIEIDHFAHVVAKLSLYLAEHQMNCEFSEALGSTTPALPLTIGGNIVCENAIRVDWNSVCPVQEGDVVYVLGNPPYLGARNQSSEQKEDMSLAFSGRKEYKDCDYIACWFLRGADYIVNRNAEFAFISTNSITQGEQVSLIWPYILGQGLEISFAYRSFKWTNNAKKNAGVTCVVLGLRNSSKKRKVLFYDKQFLEVENITPYLVSGKTIIVNASKTSISDLPSMMMGNMARDDGNLILSVTERDELLRYPGSGIFLKRFYGSNEFLNGVERWCLWIPDLLLEQAKAIPPIADRIENVRKFREASAAKTTNQYASIPHKFAQRSYKAGATIILPRVSSERREYIPFGFLNNDDSIVSDSALAIYNAEMWVFGVVSSRMHMVWIRHVCGALKTDIRYSSTLGYNTFPINVLTTNQKEEIKRITYTILEEREKHPEKTLAEMYDPEKMPQGLKEAHASLDLAVDRCYRSRPFSSDEERLETLFKLYETMTAKN